MKGRAKGVTVSGQVICAVIKLHSNSDTPYLHSGVLKGLLSTWGSVCYAHEVLNHPRVPLISCSSQPKFNAS